MIARLSCELVDPLMYAPIIAAFNAVSGIRLPFVMSVIHSDTVPG